MLDALKALSIFSALNVDRSSNAAPETNDLLEFNAP